MATPAPTPLTLRVRKAVVILLVQADTGPFDPWPFEWRFIVGADGFLFAPCAGRSGVPQSLAVRRTASGLLRRPYSWLPGTGLNLIPRKATPTGTAVDASMVIIAVQMMIDRGRGDCSGSLILPHCGRRDAPAWRKDNPPRIKPTWWASASPT